MPVCVYSLLVNKDSQNSGKYMHSRNWSAILTGLHLVASLSGPLSPGLPLAAYLKLYFPNQVCPTFNDVAGGGSQSGCTLESLAKFLL